MSTEPGGPARIALFVVGAAIMGVAIMGFLSGTATADYTFKTPITPITAVHAAHAATAHGREILPARSYTEMRDGLPYQGSKFDEDLKTLSEKLPSRLDPVELSGDKKGVLAVRASGRAYDGAPPTIPHPVRQNSAAECRGCHDKGLQIASRTANATPHANYISCTQCHAMQEPGLPWGGRSAAVGPDPRDVPNSFQGLASPERGPRWTAAAPPQIPHKTFMRENCESCHGPSGRNAMRSTHPDRQNCEQCHAPQAKLEWRPGGHP